MSEPDEKAEQPGLWTGPAADDSHAATRRACEECHTAFERGNFAEAQRQGDALLEQDPAEDVRVRTEELLDRLIVDPVAAWVAVGCFVFIALIALFTLG